MIVVRFLRGVAAIGSAPHQLASHIRRLVAVVRLLLQHIGEEEEFQHKEDDKQLDEDDCPQHPAEGHGAEAVSIEPVHLI